MKSIKQANQIKKERGNSTQTKRIYRQDIGMEIDTEKFIMFLKEEIRKTKRKKLNQQIRKVSKFLYKKKIKSTWEYWKRTPSNRDELKKTKQESTHQKNEKTSTKNGLQHKRQQIKEYSSQDIQDRSSSEQE